MTPAGFQHLLNTARATHEATKALKEFCPFPDDLTSLALDPFHVPAADLMYDETGLVGTQYADLKDAFIAAGPQARWRETYKDTDIGADFMDRFACYCLIGEGGAWISRKMSAYVVFMPAGLHYPWHQHHAEEMYFVLDGEGEFHRKGETSKILREGDACFHASNQPHALTTHDKPVMAYVIWRNHLADQPVWTPGVLGK